MRAAELLEIVDRVYDAAEKPALWPAALAPMAELFRVRAVNLLHNDADDRPDGVTVNVGVEPELVRLYNEHYVNVDPLVEVSLQQPVGVPFDSEQLFQPSRWRATALYADLMRNRGLEHICGTTLIREDGVYGALSMVRGAEGRPLAGRDREGFLVLARHVRRALKIHRALSASRQRSAVLTELVDRLSTGFVVLDAGGGVLHANEAALQIAGRRDGFVLGRRAARASTRSGTRALRAALSSAVATTRAERLEGGGSLRLERPSGRRPLEVLVTPLGALSRGAAGAAAVLMVTDPDEEPSSPAKLLAEMYGLTPREAELTQELLRGITLVEAADRLGMAQTTAKSHLKAVFAKTDTSRQSDLVRSVLHGPLGHLLWGEESGGRVKCA